MTTREFLTAVSTANVSDEVSAKALELIAALDKKNAARSSADSKEKKETAARRQAVLEFLKTATEPATREVIATATGLTPGQVTSACTAFVKSGVATKTEVKVGKNKAMAYSIA